MQGRTQTRPAFYFPTVQSNCKASSSRLTALMSMPSMPPLGAFALGTTARETQLGRLAQPFLAARRGPDLAGQPDLAEGDQIARQRPSRRLDRIASITARSAAGLADAHAADGVDEHVLVVRGDAAMAMQHRQQHRQPVAFETDASRRGLPAWLPSTSACTSTNSGRVPSSVTMTHAPGTGSLVLRQKDRRGIGAPRAGPSRSSRTRRSR